MRWQGSGALKSCADDIPTLFALKPWPVETFVRLVTLAVYQLERDLIVERLTKGLALAKKRSKRTTQFGEAKVNGTKSHLEKKKPSKKQLKKLRRVIKKQPKREDVLARDAERLQDHPSKAKAWPGQCPTDGAWTSWS